MTTLARAEANHTAAIRTTVKAVPSVPTAATLEEVWQAATYVAESKLFPVKTPQQAFALMMLAQSHGLHYMSAVERYHLLEIGGVVRPSMKAAAMHADFVADGGRVRIIRRDETEARAVFSHPVFEPEGREFAYTMENARTSGDAGKNPNYRTRPRHMLWARLISEAIDTIAPGIKLGMPTADEAEDIIRQESPAAAIVHQQVEQAREAVVAAQTQVPGQPEGQYDARKLRDVVEAGVAKVNFDVATIWEQGKVGGQVPEIRPGEVYGHLWNQAVQLGRKAPTGPLPGKPGLVVTNLQAAYQNDAEWFRGELASFLEDHITKWNPSLVKDATPAPATEDAGDPGGEYPDEPGIQG